MHQPLINSKSFMNENKGTDINLGEGQNGRSSYKSNFTDGDVTPIDKSVDYEQN